MMNLKLRFLIIFIITSQNIIAQNFNYISEYNSDGVPLDMVNTPISQGLVNNINASLPENYPVPTYNPQYLESNIETNVNITELADVWVSFVGEGAGYKNVLGYYTYDSDNPLTSAPTDSDITIIFPNVSASGSGGGLEIGDRMYLGQFPAGTTIGWVLIANGWNGNSVTYGNWMVYSDTEFNPENDSDLQKHNVNLYDNNEEVVVFGFEDIRRDYSSCDQDFNDALFLVTSNPYTAIETENYNSISQEGGDQGSGGSGGLESNRGLSSKISKRTYNRASGKSIEIPSEVQIRSQDFLDNIIPNSFKDNDRSEVSSPRDLEAFTKAHSVWSKDYFFGPKRYATVFVTETNEGIYDHTKAVCERLKGAKLESINSVRIANKEFILSTMMTESGSTEYAISFSMKIRDEQNYDLLSRWAVDQYPSEGAFYNFQIWSSTPFMTKDIINDILNNFDNYGLEIHSNDQENYVPNIYIKSGQYKNNQIVIDIVNNYKQNKEIVLIGTIAHSENDQNIEHVYEEHLIPAGNSEIVILSSESGIFDLEVKLKELNESTFDVAYFADGAWGTDYDSEKSSVTNILIEPNLNPVESDFKIDRNISLDISSNDYVSIYKHLNPSGRSQNLTAYNTIQFETEYKGIIQVSLVKKEIKNWQNQFSFYLNTNNDDSAFSIPFSYLSNKLGQEFSAEDISIVMFTVENPGGAIQSMNINDLRLTINTAISPEFRFENELTVYPNPTSNFINILIASDIKETTELCLYNNLGLKVKSISVELNEGINELQIPIHDIPTGLYNCSLSLHQGNNKSAKILIQNKD